MARRLSNGITVLCLLILLLLLSGYFMDADIRFEYARNVPHPHLHAIHPIVAGGRVRITYEHWDQPDPAEFSKGLSVFTMRPTFNARIVPYCIWYFDFHTYSPGGYQNSHLDFPVWCLGVPFLIQPIMRLHHWRKRKKCSPGFEVIANPT
jgi:hypothetical protein